MDNNRIECMREISNKKQKLSQDLTALYLENTQDISKMSIEEFVKAFKETNAEIYKLL